jgi:flagellar motor switch/type III secretory pathway protein FliN
MAPTGKALQERPQERTVTLSEKQRAGKLEHVVDLQVPLSVVLAEKSFPLEDILEIRRGALLEFSRRYDGPLDLYVNDSRVGRGHAIDFGERLGFCVDEVRRNDEGPMSDP